jgi:hypothetical protein
MASAWFIKSEGQEFGPFPFEKLRQFVSEGRIVPETLLRRADSPQWVAASTVPNLPLPASPPPELLRTVSPLPHAPTPPCPPPAPPSISDPIESATAPSQADESLSFLKAAGRLPAGLKRVSSPSRFGILDLLDPGFKRYYTPVLVKAFWVLCLVGAALSIVLSAVGTFTPELTAGAGLSHPSFGDGIVRSRHEPSAFVSFATGTGLKIVLWALGATFTLAGLVLLRIVCEFFIVIFKIASSLDSLDEKTPKRT